MRKQFNSLTSLRFVAAYFTVCYHFAPLAWRPDFGQVAVEFFFVLSGFLMATLYLAPEAKGSKDFLLRRLVRIVPGYLVGWVAFLLARLPAWTSHEAEVPWKAGLLALGALHAWVPSTSVKWNPASWSVSAEFFFYVSMSFILAIPTVKNWRRARWITLAALCVGLRVLYVCALTYARRHDGALSQETMSSVTFLHQSAVYSPLLRWPEFLMGVALGGVFLRRNPRRDETFGRVGATLGALTVAATVLFLPRFMVREELFSAITLPILLMAPLGLLIYSLGCFEPLWARKLGGSPTLRMLGESSYILYIIQFPLYYALMDLHLLGLRDQNTNWQFTLYMVLLVGASVALHQLWERKAVQRLRKELEPGGALHPTRQLA